MKLTITLLLISLTACTPTAEDEFKLGNEVPAPYGCQELRQRGGEC